MFIAFSPHKIATHSEDFLINFWDNQWSQEPIQVPRTSEAEMSQWESEFIEEPGSPENTTLI